MYQDMALAACVSGGRGGAGRGGRGRGRTWAAAGSIASFSTSVLPLTPAAARFAAGRDTHAQTETQPGRAGGRQGARTWGGRTQTVGGAGAGGGKVAGRRPPAISGALACIPRLPSLPALRCSTPE